MNHSNDLGRAIAPFCSLINHSCCPNVATMITEKGEIILYSVQSIEENEQVSIKIKILNFSYLCIQLTKIFLQIFICYGQLCLHADNFYRKLHLNMIFINCNCIACKNQWPTILRAPTLQVIFLKKIVTVFSCVEENKYLIISYNCRK